jgi:phosphoglycolate phosphatase
VTSTYRLFVFDLDGTLVDSRRDIADSANELLERCGAGPLPEEAIGRMVGNGAATLVARAFAAARLEPPPDALDRFLAIYDTRLLRHTRPYPQIADVLAALGARASLAVLTNKPRAATRSILAGLELARFFDDDAIVGGDGPFPRKPDPGGLRHLFSRAGVPPSATILVGDSLVDWRAARQAATAVCLARYGFGFEDFPLHELGPDDRTIDAPAELLAL